MSHGRVINGYRNANMAKNCIKEPELKQSEAGLADVVACQSDICFIDGDNCRLVYRGYNALDLAMNSNFEEVAYLLWYGCLPRKIGRAHV